MRRTFLKQATAATAVATTAQLLKTAVYGQNQAPSAGRVLGANDRLVVGIIGLQRGKAHITGHSAVKNVEIGDVCDVDSTRLAEGKKQAEAKQPGREVKDVTDFRRMLHDPTGKSSLASRSPELPAVGARRARLHGDPSHRTLARHRARSRGPMIGRQQQVRP